MDYNPTVCMFCIQTQLLILQLKSRNISGLFSITLVSQTFLLNMSMHTYKKLPRERLNFFRKPGKSFGQQLTE